MLCEPWGAHLASERYARHVGVMRCSAIENNCSVSGDMGSRGGVRGVGDVKVWDMENVGVEDHAFGYASAELLDLISDVEEKSL